MVYSPFDFNESIGHRKDYVEERLREGSPVVGVSADDGLYLITVCRTQRKVFEIYDRIMYSAIGNQADIEAIRVGAIEVAHREGYERSPDDVTAQRLVGFSLSPPLKRLFGDQFNAPAVVRALFAELGDTPADDRFFTLDYDGEFTQHAGSAAIAGSHQAETEMLRRIEGASGSITEIAAAGLRAWAAGLQISQRQPSDEDPDDTQTGEDSLDALLRTELASGHVEVGFLERRSTRESRFRLYSNDELRDVVDRYRTAETG